MGNTSVSPTGFFPRVELFWFDRPVADGSPVEEPHVVAAPVDDDAEPVVPSGGRGGDQEQSQAAS